jgi:uncharacterized protein YdhG (YjbR/CyaY superfamily)
MTAPPERATIDTMSETKKSASAAKASEVFSAEEKAAMRERAKELKASKSKEGDASAMAEKIAEMPDADRVLAEGIGRLVAEKAPDLSPKLWYGMPGWARGGKIVFFLQGAEKFNTRYATLGFNDIATIDDGTMWPTAYAITEWSDANEAAVAELIVRAAGQA